MAESHLIVPGRRRFLQSACILIPVMAFPGMARAASLLAVRTWPSEDYTRVTFELDRALEVNSFTLAGPDRLVVDIQGLVMNSTLDSLVSQIQFNDPYVKSVRAGQFVPQTVRLVLELKQKVAPQVFTLKPIGKYAHRLVLDLYPLVARDPIMSFLEQHQAAGSGDPLAEILANLEQSKRAAVPAPSEVGQRPAPSLPYSTHKPLANRPVVIALDPGHGGEDPGAVGRGGTREKDVVLAIARKTKAILESRPGVRTFLTRDGDYFVPLHVRVQKARRVKADLFISIHADAWTNPAARGGSVFVLSEKGASSAMARTLARQQNAADLIGGVNLKHHDKRIAQVLLDLSTTAQIGDSTRLASHILTNMGNVGALHKKHVESAGFAVLKAPDIPSVLVETAFISNPEEERMLRSDGYQLKLAEAIASGVQRYFGQGAALAKG